jgi:hypothetical protein
MLISNLFIPIINLKAAGASITGIRSVFNDRKVGAYGGYYVIKRLFDSSKLIMAGKPMLGLVGSGTYEHSSGKHLMINGLGKLTSTNPLPTIGAAGNHESSQVHFFKQPAIGRCVNNVQKRKKRV